MADDLLGPLRDEPIPPLAPAATVRARGEQRRRRTRAGLAGAVALVLVGATGIALGGARDSDELRPAPFATSSAGADPLWEALLDPEDVEQVLGGAWDDLRGHESPLSSELEGCPETPASVYPSAARFLTDGEAILAQSASLHADSAEAEERHRQLLAMVRACGEANPAYRLFDPGSPSSTRVFGEVILAGQQVRPFSLERVGRSVVTLVLQGPSELSPELAEAAADEVRAVLGDEPDAAPSVAPSSPAASPSPEPGAAWSLPEAFLPASAADAAEQLPGAWSVTVPHDPDDEAVADPCGQEGVALPDAVAEQDGRAMGSEREAGGSSLVQEVYRYSSATTAAQAFSEYEQRWSRCASVQDPHADQGWTIRSEVVDRQVGPDSGRLLVRRIPCQPEDVCADHFSTYAMVVREADALTAVAYMIAEDGDPAQEAQALVRAVQQQLRRAVA